MGERILYFWLRFRWFIIAGALLVTIGAGAISGTFLQGGTSSTVTTIPTQAPEAVVVVADGENALASCEGIEKRDELFACRVAVGARTPIVLDDAGTGFLVGDAWQGIGGVSAALDLTGASADTLTGLSAGVTVDLDNDGFPEYVIASGQNAELLVLSQNPGGGVRDTAKARGLDSIPNVNLILPLDADRDGWLDLVVSSTRTPDGDGQTSVAGRTLRGVDILFNRGWEAPGAFDLRKSVRIAPTAAGAVAPLFLADHVVDGYVGDIDGDGELDVALIDRRGGAAIHWGSTSPNWGEARPQEFRVPIGVTGLDAGDVDGDGDIDLVASYDVSLGSAFGNLCPVQLNGRPCTLAPGMSLYGGVAVLVQDPARSVAMSETLSVKDVRNASDVVLADIDGDRSAEIVVSRETVDGEGGVTVYRNASSDDSVTTFVAGESIGTGAVSSIRAVDLDGNGMPDIAMTGRGTSKAQLWVNSNAPTRFLHLDLRGAGSFETFGTSRSALGVQVTLTDIDNRTLTVTSDADHLGEGLLFSLPLTSDAWAGNEAVPRVEVTFPLTGRSLTLTNVATGERRTVDEPEK